MTTTGQELERQQRNVIQLVPTYRAEFADTLPAHVKPETFIRVAQGALRKSPDLLKAANNDPTSFFYALREAARLGHEPGSDSFYLVSMGGKVEGWEGYRGVVERMYRAGAVASVVAEVVRENDVFDWRPGAMDRPQHTVDWFGGGRGHIVGAYSYAVMQNGAVSKVVVIGRDYIDKVKRESRSSSSASSPWVKWEDAMVLKTAVHRLEPFVPTSSEYRKEQLRALRDVQAEAPAVVANPETGEIVTAELVDGES